MCVLSHILLSYDPFLLDCSLSGSSVHRISQATILKPIAISSSRGSSDPGIQLATPALAGRFFTIWATWEAPESHAPPLKDRVGVESRQTLEGAWPNTRRLAVNDGPNAMCSNNSTQDHPSPNTQGCAHTDCLSFEGAPKGIVAAVIMVQALSKAVFHTLNNWTC